MPLDRYDVLLRKAKQDELVLERLLDDRDVDDDTLGFHAHTCRCTWWLRAEPKRCRKATAPSRGRAAAGALASLVTPAAAPSSRSISSSRGITPLADIRFCHEP